MLKMPGHVSNTKMTFLIILVMALAGYAVHMNIKLNSAVSRYETSASEMADRFEKVNEEALRAREELERQVVASERAGAAVEAAAAEVAKVINEVKQDTPVPEEEVPAEPVIAVKADAPISSAKAKAEKARAEAEALLSQIGNKPSAWEERGAHL